MIEKLSIIDQIDGGQISLELYLFWSSENHSPYGRIMTI